MQQRSCRCCRILCAKSKANLKVLSLDSNNVTARGFGVLSRSLFTCHNGGIRNRRAGGLTLQLTTLMRLLAPGDQASTAHVLLPAESTANKERRRPPTNTAPPGPHSPRSRGPHRVDACRPATGRHVNLIKYNRMDGIIACDKERGFAGRNQWHNTASYGWEWPGSRSWRLLSLYRHFRHHHGHHHLSLFKKFTAAQVYACSLHQLHARRLTV